MWIPVDERNLVFKIALSAHPDLTKMLQPTCNEEKRL